MLEPQVPQALHIFISAFYRLCSERPSTMGGLASIPMTSVIIYAERYCVSVSQQERMIDYVMAMDVAYVNHINSKKD